MQAFIVTKTDCPFCVKAKEFMVGMDIEYKESILGADVLWDDETREKYKTVPQIWINETHIGGYDNLVEWAING